MLRVKNKKTIRRLADRSFAANKTRNIMAVIAVILTTLLFSALFTAAISIKYSTEQSTMRQVGGYAHGGFKEVTDEQKEALITHPLIEKYGTNKVLTALQDGIFSKERVEVRYSDDIGADMYFCKPTTGSMPGEKMELATDTRILDLLGVPHKVGEKITVPFVFHGETREETFTLSGFWERDEAAMVSEMWLSEAFVDEMLSEYEPDSIMESMGAGLWNVNICFKNSQNIEENLRKIAEDNGYDTVDPMAENYLRTGVNWAYLSTHTDTGGALLNIGAIAVLCMMIVLTGYLIINNIFQISVSGDIRFYGLLKTIGTTGRQIKALIRRQALKLCILGLPLGMIAGYLAGNQITSLIMRNMSEEKAYLTLNPWIFIGAALFSLFTVLLSCRKPGKIAASVSPVEAVRYVEASPLGKRLQRKEKRGSRILNMALANLGRSRKRTILVILSLSLSVVLLYGVSAFSAGFDMNKFVGKFVTADYLIANKDLFKSMFGSKNQELDKTVIQTVNSQEGIKEAGLVYYDTGITHASMTKEQYLRTLLAIQLQTLDDEIRAMNDNDWMEAAADLFGLDEVPFQYLDFVEGQVDYEELKKGDTIIQLVHKDDYGVPYLEKAPYSVGDKVTLSFADDYEYIGDDMDAELIVHKSHEKTYTIGATAVLPNSLSLRRYGGVDFAMASDVLKGEKGDDAARMCYILNMEEDAVPAMEDFLEQYTKEIDPSLDFESKKSYSDQFQSFRRMFLLVGGSASLVVALVGILNYINAIVTGIRARRRELAVLQSIGMTGRQLKEMLILEGSTYGILAILLSLLLSLVLQGLVLRQLEHLLWFFTAKWIWAPIFGMLFVFLALGVVIPVLAYRIVERQSVVERLREAE
ncbi:MAG: ABC transporter permease [Lachnospiraceae bacterium]|jgi:putative ABC transport system permease protein|nr:ABC transporter permease [Lachnospiraceae bacterium]MCI8863232.1 ABC transporter permease [Lachnospiraceae bacterium]